MYRVILTCGSMLPTKVFGGDYDDLKAAERAAKNIEATTHYKAEIQTLTEKEPSSMIWNDTKIPVLGVAGEKGNGKTLFVSSIDPKGTCMIDLEESSASYSIPFKTRYDLRTMLTDAEGTPSPQAIFEWFRNKVEEIKPGEYTVLAVDPITDLEQGLVDWVQNNPEEFGRSKAQYERAQGIMWGDVKAYWKRLLMQISAKVETFAFTAHMGQVWSGNSPTQRRKPKGKETLYELASLYLLVERKADNKGVVPDVPSATVLKSRLAVTTIADDGTVTHQPILPPRLPQATPAAVRKYIESPPNYKKLKAGEKAVAEQMSDDEKLLLQSEIANANAEAERLKTERSERAEAAAASARKANAKSKPAPPPVDTKAQSEALGKRVKELEEEQEAKQPPVDARHALACDRLAKAITAVGLKPEQLTAILSKRNAKIIEDLTWEQAEEIAIKLEDKMRGKRQTTGT